MKISIPNCPTCGEPAEGTVDDVPGIALFGDIDKEGRTKWGGETRIYWDDQKSRSNDAGEVLVQCSTAHEWYTAIDYTAAQDAIDAVEAAEKEAELPPPPDDSSLLVSFEPQAIRDHFEDSDEWGDFVSALSDDELRDVGMDAMQNDQTWKTFDETLITALAERS
jgi:hypothetical protein